MVIIEIFIRVASDLVEMKDILYCEDERVVRDEVVSTLQHSFSSYRIISSSDIRSALERITSVGQLGVVLTDGNLFGDDTGWDLAEQLRQRGYTGLIVYLGGAKIPEDKRELFSDILIKPADADRVVKTLEKYL